MLSQWVKLPTAWIEAKRLTEFVWSKGQGSAAAAGLMVLAAIAHRVDQENGVARLTYNELTEATSLSRTKVSDGLRYMEEKRILSRLDGKQSFYQLNDYDPKSGWGMLPCKRMYRANRIDGFQGFTLRSRADLDALKIYFTFVSRRDRKKNVILLNYDLIEAYSGVQRINIKKALSLLVVNGLISSYKQPRSQFDERLVNVYTLENLKPSRAEIVAEEGFYDVAEIFAV